MNEGRVAVHAAVGCDFKCPEIRHTMAGMDRQTLALHPTYIAGFFVKRCNVHYRFAPVKTSVVIFHQSQISSPTTQFPEGTVIRCWSLSDMGFGCQLMLCRKTESGRLVGHVEINVAHTI